METTFFCKNANGYHDPTMDQLARYLERALVITDNQEQISDSSTESSNPEVSKKLESRKYYRRSAVHTYQNDDLSTSDSSDTHDEQNSDYSHHGSPTSSSLSDNPGSKRRLADETTEPMMLKRFAPFPTPLNNLHHNEVKTKAKNVRLGKDNLPQIGKNPETGSFEFLDYTGLMETLPVNIIVDLWERSQIPHGRVILLALGFGSDDINLAQLNKAIEEVLPTMYNNVKEQHITLMKACLALPPTELATLRQTSKQRHDENTKQMVDTAVEINDRRNASLEYEPKQEVRSLEEWHAEVTSDDSDSWSTFERGLNRRLKTYKPEKLELVSTRKGDLESCRHKMQKQSTEMLKKNVESQCELTEKYESQHLEQALDDGEILRLDESYLHIDNCSTDDTCTPTTNFPNDGRVSQTADQYMLEQQYSDLKAEAKERRNIRKRLHFLRNEIRALKVCESGESLEPENMAINAYFTGPCSPASRPISYVMHDRQ